MLRLERSSSPTCRLDCHIPGCPKPGLGILVQPHPRRATKGRTQNEEKISNISNIEIESDKIGALVMLELRNIDKVAFIRFASVYREFKDLSEFQAQIDDLKNKF